MSLFKGWLGEKMAMFHMWVSLPAITYHKFHGIILPSQNGTTQIDHLIVSVYGLFIVETKNKKGWIYGSDDDHNWTQTLIGKTYCFQNPLKQVYRQKKVLAEFLDLYESKIYTVVYFVGDSTFKTSMPDNVINQGICKYIKHFQKPIITPEDVDQILHLLEKHLAETSITSKDHLNSLHERHNSNTICPKCGSPLVERTAKQGANAGRKFLGCGNYPKCWFSRDLGQK